MNPSREISDLIEIMAALRQRDGGCPWDIEQTFATIAPYTIEEAYEVADAIAEDDMPALRDELGDLLLQVVYHARMAEEIGAFSFSDVVEAITSKLIRRHPHVFGDAEARAAGAAKGQWERIKTEERRARGIERDGALDGVLTSLPALIRALKLQEKASTVGFDWKDPRVVLAKIREEVDEIEAELDGDDRGRREEEIGDLLFATVNLARHLQLDADQALRSANAKFVRRFTFIEEALAQQGLTPNEASLSQMEALWQEAKGDRTTEN